VPDGPGRARDLTGLLGRKVSVRYRLHDDPVHPFSEAVGVVSSVSTEDGHDVVKIVHRKGTVIAIPAPDVLAIKVFPV
jgi:hypothetical protein